MLTRPLVSLLSDESPAVQAAVLPMLNVTLEHICQGPQDKRDISLAEVLAALVHLEAHSARNWRVQVRAAACLQLNARGRESAGG